VRATRTRDAWEAPPATEIVTSLHRVSPFSELDAPTLEHLVRSSAIRREHEGAVVFREGEFGRSLFIVLDGTLEVGISTEGLDHVLLALLPPVSVVGEMAALSGRPRTATVIVAEPAWLLEVPEEVLTEARKRSPAFERALNDLQTHRALERALRKTPLFATLVAHEGGEEAFARILKGARARVFEKGEVLFDEGDAGRALFVVASGFVKVTKRIGGITHVVGYHTTGGFFGERALLTGDVRSATVTAFTRVEVFEVLPETLTPLLASLPALREALERAVDERDRATSDVARNPSRSGLLAQAVDLGLLQAGRLLVIDETVCTGCDNCVTACQARHGEKRLDRHGPRVAHVTIPVACRLCDDPVCLLCPYEAIERAPTGEIFITDTCTGCTGCVRRCPYDVIRMRDVTPSLMQIGRDRLAQGARPGAGGRTPVRRRAVKCDHCLGFEDEACVRNCPVHAIYSVNPLEFFRDPAVLQRP
jgi:CRP-like cAMP-binding protein